MWWLPGERLIAEFVSTRIFGGGGVMVWGCFLYYAVGSVMVVRGKMNSQAYCTVLDNGIFPSACYFYGMVLCYFQDDNTSCHVSEATMQRCADSTKGN